MDKSALLQVVYQAIDVVNELRGDDEQIPKRDDVVLAGSDGVLDSLALVTLILAVESKVAELTGESVGLLDDSDFSDDVDRIRTPSAIVELVSARIA